MVIPLCHLLGLAGCLASTAHLAGAPLSGTRLAGPGDQALKARTGAVREELCDTPRAPKESLHAPREEGLVGQSCP